MPFVNIGLEDKTPTEGFLLDPIDALEGVVAATENLTITAQKYSVLCTAMEGVESSTKFAAAVAEKTGDNGVAIAAGAEGLKVSLSFIGQAHAAAQVTAGVESLEAGVEASEGVFAAMWKTSKELAEKVWKYIKELITKVVNYVKSLFGKKEDTYESLIKLLKKAKEDGRTKLKIEKFDKAVRERLVKEVCLVALVNEGKDITDTVISDFISVQAALVKSITDDKPSFGPLLEKAGQVAAEAIKLGVKLEKDGTVTPETAVEIVTKDLNPKIKEKFSEFFGKSGETFLAPITKETEAYFNLFKSEIDEKVPEYDHAIITLTGVAANKVSFGIIYTTDDGKEAYEKLAKNESKDLSYLRSNVKKVIAGIKFTTVTVTAKEEDYKECEENIVPLEYSDATSIADKFKAVNKGLDKSITKFEKVLRKEEKAFDKDAEKLIKDIKDAPSDSRKVIEVMLSVADQAVKLELNIKKAMAMGATMTATDLARAKVGHIVKESVSNYGKK